MSVALAAASAAVLMAVQATQATNRSFEAEDQARQEAKERIKEAERQAEGARDEAKEKRSDRVREADREFASLVVAMSEGGGLGTTSLLRLGGEVGANEGRDIYRIGKNEEEQLGAIHAEARAAAAGFKAAAKEQRYARSQIAIGTIMSGIGLGMQASAASGSGSSTPKS